MAQGKLTRRLSAQDASFLYFEREEAPMHIGSIAVFESELPYERFVENITSKLHLIPRYLQKVVPAPFNIGHPTWEWDPQFDITNHVKLVKMDPPGTHEQLIELAGRLFAPLLDRKLPLWEINVVQGLEGGRSALVSKVHHCLVDGVSGIELLMIVMDVSPSPPPPPPPPEAEDRRGPGGPVTRITDAILDNMSARLDRWAETQDSLVEGVAEGGGRIRRSMRALEEAAPYFSVPVARAPFNRPLVPGRHVAISEFSFAEIRSIRQACGGTVNDVVLAVLGGAMGRYLEMHGQTTSGRTVRVLTPVNVRREGERGALGNRVAMLLVEVPAGIQDPVQRLKDISARTDRLKRRQVADGMELLWQSLSTTPPALQALAGAMPAPPNTVANMVCTNVPGPMIPLYSVGVRLQSHFPLIPIAWEMGVGCGVTSYDQKLYFGLMGDGKAADDVRRLKEFLDQSYVELRAAAGVGKSDLPQVGVQPAPVGTPRRAAGERAGPMAADAG
jgi:diacylglycerol O-acyltransferase / wax synthase